MVKPPSRPVNRKNQPGDHARIAASELAAAATRLRAAGVETPAREAEVLLAWVLGVSRARLLAERAHWRLGSAPVARFRRLVARRAQRVPLQYLTGEVTYADLDLRVGPGVLIPRPETELVIAEAVRRAAPLGPCGMADLGTGTGALALALAKRFPEARVFGTDLSPAALRWARLNRRRLRVRNLRLLAGSAAEPLPKLWLGRLTLVVSNPPYIRRRDLRGLAPEVRREPRLALDGGPDGLDGLRTMAVDALRWLQPGGVFVCELGIGQAGRARRLLTGLGFIDLEVLEDWNRITRVISGLRPGGPITKTVAGT
jgi:release factor glutamine methyltransferase